MQTYLREVILKDLFVASEKLRRKGRCTVAQRKLTDAMQLIEDSAKLMYVTSSRTFYELAKLTDFSGMAPDQWRPDDRSS